MELYLKHNVVYDLPISDISGVEDPGPSPGRLKSRLARYFSCFIAVRFPVVKISYTAREHYPLKNLQRTLFLF